MGSKLHSRQYLTETKLKQIPFSHGRLSHYMSPTHFFKLLVLTPHFYRIFVENRTLVFPLCTLQSAVSLSNPIHMLFERMPKSMKLHTTFQLLPCIQILTRTRTHIHTRERQGLRDWEGGTIILHYIYIIWTTTTELNLPDSSVMCVKTCV